LVYGYFLYDGVSAFELHYATEASGTSEADVVTRG
jgi:hypothetical protein